MENNINVGIQIDEEKKGKSGGLKLLILFIIVFAVAFGVGYFVGVKLLPIDNTKCEKVENKEDMVEKNDELKCPEISVDFLKVNELADNFLPIFHNVFDKSYEHLIPIEKRDVNLLEDKVTNFRIAYYFAYRYADGSSKMYNNNVYGKEETGAYAIKYNVFKDYYKKIFGIDFDESVINEIDEQFVLKGDYLYGTIITGERSDYEIVAQSFEQNENKYYLTMGVRELNDEEEVVNSYNVKIEFNSSNQIVAIIAD